MDMYMRRYHVNMKAEVEVMHLQAKERQRLAGEHQKLGETHGADSSSQTSGGTLDLELLASRPVKQSISVD